MKGRESGMPEEAYWESFFNPAEILRALGLDAECHDVAELGCGYGTFTLPAAALVSGTVYAFDIDPEMLRRTADRAQVLGLHKIQTRQRDFLGDGTGLPDCSVDCVLLFNILHIEDPARLIAEAWRILRPGGSVAVIHWNYDSATPRGPSLAIRPRPEDCARWCEAGGLSLRAPGIVDLPPYHYGFAAVKTM
jgi:SAM-dependent methyltransferase